MRLPKEISVAWMALILSAASLGFSVYVFGVQRQEVSLERETRVRCFPGGISPLIRNHSGDKSVELQELTLVLKHGEVHKGRRRGSSISRLGNVTLEPNEQYETPRDSIDPELIGTAASATDRIFVGFTWVSEDLPRALRVECEFKRDRVAENFWLIHLEAQTTKEAR